MGRWRSATLSSDGDKSEGVAALTTTQALAGIYPELGEGWGQQSMAGGCRRSLWIVAATVAAAAANSRESDTKI